MHGLAVGQQQGLFSHAPLCFLTDENNHEIRRVS